MGPTQVRKRPPFRGNVGIETILDRTGRYHLWYHPQILQLDAIDVVVWATTLISVEPQIVLVMGNHLMICFQIKIP